MGGVALLLILALLGVPQARAGRPAQRPAPKETFFTSTLPKSEIANKQAVQFMLAEMALRIYTMESIVYRTAWAIDQGQKVSRESAIVKMLCSEYGAEIVDRALQIHGGMGYMCELPIERFYRDERVNRIFEGTSEIQRIVIARDLQKKGRY